MATQAPLLTYSPRLALAAVVAFALAIAGAAAAQAQTMLPASPEMSDEMPCDAGCSDCADKAMAKLCCAPCVGIQAVLTASVLQLRIDSAPPAHVDPHYPSSYGIDPPTPPPRIFLV